MYDDALGMHHGPFVSDHSRDMTLWAWQYHVSINSAVNKFYGQRRRLVGYSRRQNQTPPYRFDNICVAEIQTMLWICCKYWIIASCLLATYEEKYCLKQSWFSEMCDYRKICIITNMAFKDFVLIYTCLWRVSDKSITSYREVLRQQCRNVNWVLACMCGPIKYSMISVIVG